MMLYRKYDDYLYDDNDDGHCDYDDDNYDWVSRKRVMVMMVISKMMIMMMRMMMMVMKVMMVMMSNVPTNCSKQYQGDQTLCNISHKQF